jgi:hypothetical protein
MPAQDPTPDNHCDDCGAAPDEPHHLWCFHVGPDQPDSDFYDSTEEDNDRGD